MKIMRLVVLLALVLLCRPLQAADVLLKQPGRWAQDYTGRKADPSIRFGTLPNGFRYAIKRNETPKDGVTMRLRIGAGSLAERDEEQGLAHFLEHMAFRGSKNLPDGEVVRTLERQGLRFGPDTNAYTTHDETVYTFTFPKADEGAVGTGLLLFREIGERLNLDPAIVETEKAVILSEERVRDVPGYRGLKANVANALAGTRAPSRWPIGVPETIRGATSDRLRRYYQANYRPDNATLIVVGVVDVARVEAEIKARFGDWKAAGVADATAPGVPTPKEPASEFVANGAQDLLTLSWVRGVDPRAETEAVNREELLKLLGLTILNNRLGDRATKPGSAIVSGQAYVIERLFGSAAMTQIAISAAPENWRAALAAAIEDQRQLLEQGATADELARASTQLLTLLQTRADGAATRTSSDIADELVQAVGDDRIATSPEQDLALARSLLPTVTLNEVDSALKATFAGKGPVLFRSAQKEAATVAALASALREDLGRTLEQRTADAKIDWPYTDFGARAKTVSRVQDAELGTTTVSFDTGTRLIVKPTPFEKDTVHIAVALGNGRKGAPESLTHALWSVQFLPFGGTGKMSLGDLIRWSQSTGKAIETRVNAEVGAFVISSKTRPTDFQSALEALTAAVRDPGFRPELDEKIIAAAPMFAGQIEANAGAVFNRELQAATLGGDRRFVVVPDRAGITRTRSSELKELLASALAGPADVAIVGAIDPEQAIAAVQTTLAAGPIRSRDAEPRVTITMPEGSARPFEAVHGGRADQAFYGLFWRLPDFFANMKLSHAGAVAAAVLQGRLVETVRQQLGMTYSPAANSVASTELPGLGFLLVRIETRATNFEAFRTLVLKQIEDLAANPISADEFARAKTPLIETRRKELETNDYWAFRLPVLVRNPRVKAHILARVEGIAATTPEDVRALFANEIRGKLPVAVVVRAESK